jgi:hypothetical protein
VCVCVRARARRHSVGTSVDHGMIVQVVIPMRNS